MAAEVIYRVFVSSTFEDLREERSEVQKALLRAKCFPIGMELFPSTDEETWDFIKRQIADSDYYVVIVAGRYGTPASSGISFTEMEYDYAREIGKPILAFVHGDRGKIIGDKLEKSEDGRPKLEKFITRIREKPLVASYQTPHELGLQVLTSIMELKERKPAVGFVRADQAADYKKYAALLEENAILRKEVGDLRGGVVEPFPESAKSLEVSIKIRPAAQSPIGPQPKEQTISTEILWAEILKLIADCILLRSSYESSISSEMARVLAKLGRTKGHAYIEGRSLEKIKTTLYGRGLVTFERVDSSGGGPGNYLWHLTDDGQRQYGLLLDALPANRIQDTKA